MQKSRRINLSLLSTVFLSIVLSTVSIAQPAPHILVKADSLFSAKQYTQASELYESIYQSGRYSPAMLLKMAYIEEALHHLGRSLYFLNLYYLASDDHQALKKMEELAIKNNLEGYATSETTAVAAWFRKNFGLLIFVLAAAGTFLIGLLYFQKVRQYSNTGFTASLVGVVSILLAAHLYYNSGSERAIIAYPFTYLMSSPSSASSVVAIVGEGHQLEIQGRRDVWLEVRWKDKPAFVKQFLVQPIRL